MAKSLLIWAASRLSTELGQPGRIRPPGSRRLNLRSGRPGPHLLWELLPVKGMALSPQTVLFAGCGQCCHNTSPGGMCRRGNRGALQASGPEAQPGVFLNLPSQPPAQSCEGTCGRVGGRQTEHESGCRGCRNPGGTFSGVSPPERGGQSQPRRPRDSKRVGGDADTRPRGHRCAGAALAGCCRGSTAFLEPPRRSHYRLGRGTRDRGPQTTATSQRQRSGRKMEPGGGAQERPLPSLWQRAQPRRPLQRPPPSLAALARGGGSHPRTSAGC